MPKSRTLFPDDNALLAIAQTKQVEASALPEGPEKRALQREAVSYQILADVEGWLSGELKPPT
jgi:hypothetical protein